MVVGVGAGDAMAEFADGDGDDAAAVVAGVLLVNIDVERGLARLFFRLVWGSQFLNASVKS